MRKAGYHTFRRIVHRSAEAAGLEINVTPHTFRRSCTTELIRGGANLYHVKELLGHENLETLKHYTKLSIEDLHPRPRSARSGEMGQQGGSRPPMPGATPESGMRIHDWNLMR